MTLAPRHPGLTVVIPAHQEERLIGRCLDALAASGPVAAPVQVIVAANGCTDGTVAAARARAPVFAARDWTLVVLDLPDGGKPGALNAADAAALHAARLYLDADVTVDPRLLALVAGALDRDGPVYASGRVRITASPRGEPGGWVSRAYARMWARVPFMAQGVPGCGLFAVNAAGRARWGAFPAIIADDAFVRLHFAPAERVMVDAAYDWPVAPGFRALLRVRRRQNRGVAEIAERFPALLANEDKARPAPASVLRMALADPVGFAVYGAVSVIVALAPARDTAWSRGR
jgi:glycosyltransferase involved in cell wall biosynthesis